MKLSMPTLTASSSRQTRILLAVLSGLLALWLAWSGWSQWQDQQRTAALGQVRDTVVSQLQDTLATDRKRLDEWVASAPAQQALAGDAERLPEMLRQDWEELTSAQLLPAELSALYEDPVASGVGRLMLAESALAEGKAVSSVVSLDGESSLLLAVPLAQAQGELRVLLAALPLQRVSAPVQQARLPGNTYIALRQGAVSVVEHGNRGFSQRGEVLARKIEGSQMRLAAGVPEPTEAALGLGAVTSLVGALLMALAAALLVASLFGIRIPLLRKREADADASEYDPDSELTLAEALARDPVLEPEPTAATLEDAGVSETSKPVGIVRSDVDPGIFRAYDIRGVVGKSLDHGVAIKIGQAIGSVMVEQDLESIVIGRDGRLSGPEMVDGLIEGLRSTGRDVIDIGMVPTPVVYFGAYELRAGCGVAVTGSHNPPDYNGFKIVLGGTTLAGEAITDLYERISEGRLHEAHRIGNLSQRDISQNYIDRIARDVQMARPLKVVVDAGNGVAGELGPQVLQAIGAEVVPLYCEIDGEFPNHHPDPSEPHNLADLIQMVGRLGADVGLAFDGDGDRLGVVTSEGENIFPDRLLMLFAEDVLERNPGAQIIYDVKCTGRLAGHVLRHGGSPLMWKTGHSLVKAKMRETGAELAGEMSGHFFFQERWFGFDDGIYAAARLLEILASRDETPTEVLAELPNGISTPEIKVDAPAGDPHAFVAKFQQQAMFGEGRRTTIDGLRVDWDDGWGLVRASNTTPVLVLRFDADSKDALARIKADFREQLLALDPELSLPF